MQCGRGQHSLGSDAQLHGELVAGTQRLQVTAHPGLIGDDRTVFSVAFSIAAIAARCVIDTAARDVEQPLGGPSCTVINNAAPPPARSIPQVRSPPSASRGDCADQVP
jgi:hypothetical protein